MITNKPRAPKKGERVGFQGGVYSVVEIYPDKMKADLQLLSSGHVEKDVPWGTMTFLQDEDASQSAARIVREATENK